MVSSSNFQILSDMTSEEKKLFSQASRFQDSGPVVELDFANDMEESSRDSPIAFPSGANYWEATRGAKLRGCGFDRRTFSQHLVGLQLTEDIFNYEPISEMSEEKKQERIEQHISIMGCIADLKVLLDLYKQLREMVKQERLPESGWHWKVGLWEQTEIWKQMRPKREDALRNRSKYEAFKEYLLANV
jgi:hypothetical protein